MKAPVPMDAAALKKCRRDILSIVLFRIDKASLQNISAHTLDFWRRSAAMR
jgi:hypothetical protein